MGHKALLAAAIAARNVGAEPNMVRRFTTGMHHHVFDVAFADKPPVVVRIGDPASRAALEGAIDLSSRLRPLGIPLPALLAADTEAEFPWMLLERSPGSDLGAVISSLSDSQLDRIAASVALAQASAAGTAHATRYGYAVRAEEAPYVRWSEVLNAHFARSWQRIASVGLFDIGLAEPLLIRLDAMREEIDTLEATPFLHDTTTKNVIIAPDGTLSGIVDVDELCFGDPRYPAALTLAVLTAYGGPTSYVAAWLRHAHQSDDRLFRLYVCLFLLDLMSEHGQVFNGNEQPSTQNARLALQRVFEASIAGMG